MCVLIGTLFLIIHNLMIQELYIKFKTLNKFLNKMYRNIKR